MKEEEVTIMREWERMRRCGKKKGRKEEELSKGLSSS
jgi:hypothetical protein